MSTRFKNILSILFVTLFLLGSVLSASAAAPEAVIPALAQVSGYYLPWKGGDSYRVSGSPQSHTESVGYARGAVDFGLPRGTSVRAMKSGTIAEYKSAARGGGILITIDTDDGYCSVYHHLSAATRTSGYITQGEEVGKSGAGSNGAVHLHTAVFSKSANGNSCKGYDTNRSALSNEANIIFVEIGRIVTRQDVHNRTSWKSQNSAESGEMSFSSGRSTISINKDEVNLQVCANNLAGKTVFVQMWRATSGGHAESVWNVSMVAGSNCVNFINLDGAGPVLPNVTYYTVASLNPIAAGQAKLQRTACYTATGGKQLCDALSYKEGATCSTPGKNVDNAFLLDVISNLNTQTEYTVSNTEFALKALQIWQKYEGTNACWNPLATTWGRPNATNFNSVGVKNYATREDGVAATANTIGTRNAANYSFIRQMLGLKGFDEAGLVANLKKYSGGGAYVTNMMNEWRALYNQYAEITPPPAQNIPEFNYPVNGQTLDYEGHYIFEVKPVNGATGFLWGFEQNGQLIWENWRDEGKLNDTGYRITPNTAAHNKFSPGPVKVIVRAQIDGKWSEARIITIHLKPREGENPPAQNIPEFNYPVNGQTLDYEGHYIFEVKPVNGATGFLWGFEQNGQLIWENWRDEGKLNDTGYRITPNTAAHNKFSPGPVKVIVRAQIDGKWSEARIITIHLKPREGENPPAQNIPEFNYPVNGQTLDYEGHYIFEVKPVNGATGFLWGFEQNGQLIWENWRDEGKLNDTGYRITPNTAAHNKFSPGPVKVIVRAQIDGKWSEAQVITIHLKPKDDGTSPQPPMPVEQSQASMQWTSPSVEKGQSITAILPFDPQGQPVKGLEYVCTTDNARLQYKNATVASAFGNNPVFAPIAQSDGSFIFPVAGSNGQVMSSSGIVGSLTFETIGAGQVSLDCTVRRLTTADELQQVPFTTSMLTITETEVTPPPDDDPSDDETPGGEDEGPADDPELDDLTISGQLTLLNKAYSSAKVTVENATGEEVASVMLDADGNFQVALPAGEYTLLVKSCDTLLRRENIPPCRDVEHKYCFLYEYQCTATRTKSSSAGRV
jgi:hypothetical protein